MKRGMKKTAAACCIALMLLSGCGKMAGTVSTNTAVSAASEQSDSSTTADNSQSAADVDSMFTDRDKEVGYDEDECIAITLSDDGSSCDSSSVAVEGQTITITEEGTYLLSGSLSDGMIVIDTDENVKVRLILNGVTINNNSSAAIYVKSADKVFVTLAPDSDNILSNGGTYEAIDDNNIDSVIFSKSDLTLNGSGSLTITAAAGHGIVSKDDLVITGGTYNITAAGQGLSGKDSIRILDGDFTIASEKDALHAENEDNAEKGFIFIAGGTFDLTASGDGISASGDMTLLDGTYTMITGGGSENGESHQEEGPGGQGEPGGGMAPSGERPQGEPGEMPDGDQTPPSDNAQNNASSDNSDTSDSRPTPPSDGQQPSGQRMERPDKPDEQADEASAESPESSEENVAENKADEADTNKTDASEETSGETQKSASAEESESDETTSTKGIKANGNLIISGGTYTINAADDGVHSNSNITINGGTLTIASGDDGIHADGQATVNDGVISISECYEGIEGNEKVLIAGGQITLTSSDDGLNGDAIEISGGHTEIDAEGDGIDSNGTLTVSGGETYVSGPTGDGDGALDYETDAVITGGILIAAGSSGMAVNFGDDSTQGSILLNMDSQEAGTDIVLTDASGTELLSWQTSKKYASVVISCPEIVQGESYTVKAGTSETTVTMDSLIYGTGNTMGR